MIKWITGLPSKLTRVTSGRKLIKEVDGLRFFAIVPVLIQHLTERFERNTSFVKGDVAETIGFLAHRGFIGVYIFFVISGFILSLPFASYFLKGSEKISIRTYFWRRITRLEPPYIIWLTIFFIIFLLTGVRSFQEYLPHYLANLTYTHGLIYHLWSPFNPPTWTLEIEIQFYILAPFLAMLCFKLKNKVLRRALNVLLIVALILIQQHFGLYKNPYNLTILGHLHYFLIGFILSDIYLSDWTEKQANKIYDFAGLASVFGLIYLWSWDYELSNRLYFPICLFIFFVCCFRGVFINSVLRNRWIMAIGGMCYTIYLIHLPFAELFIKISKNLNIGNSYSVNLLFQLLMFLPIVLFLSAIFYITLEKPFMNKDWPGKFKAFLRSALNKKL
ncbi:acyltransferase family protein [Pedobacter deserti]|uniref:acyltransferase family protein n=1 Tax=Pedobacter deserti TaxID=2817382 RepID=UPI00351E6F31